MNLLWDLYWPIVAAAVVIGVIAGMVAFGPARVRSGERSAQRSRRLIRRLAIPFGALAVLLLTAIWHGPFGAADRFRTQVETDVRVALVDWEMEQVEGRLAPSPMSRTVVLSGPADDFQRRELVRIVGGVPGVSDVRWAESRGAESFKLPLLAEVGLWSLVAFGLGLLLSYLIELRRRARSEWRW